MTDVDLHPRQLNLISLCTGGGGLDRAIELACPAARPVLYVEREAFACAALVAQMQDVALAEAPIFGDARSVPGRRYRGIVDGVIGGIPCQEWSLAGQRRGDTGERDLWSPARRTLVQSGAWFVWIENVGGILSAGKGKMPGAERIRRDLRRLGFEVEAGLFTASEVGLPHERERAFFLGVADARSPGLAWRRPPGDRPGERAATERGGERLEHAEGVGRRKGRPEPELRSGRGAAASAGGDVANPDGGASRPGTGGTGQVVDPLGGGHHGRPESPQREAERRAAVEWAERGPLRPPGPSDIAGWTRYALDAPDRLPALSRHDRFRIEIGAALAAAHGDPSARPAQAWGDTAPGTWLDPAGPYGLRAAVVQAIAESCLRRGSDGLASRIDQLRLLGNGVVPMEGALAFRTLATRLAARSAGAAFLVRMMEVREP